MKITLKLPSVLLLGWFAQNLGTAQTWESTFKPFATPFVSQREYIESSILKDAGLMLLYAKNGAARETDVKVEATSPVASQYRISVGGAAIDVSLSNTVPMWEPARYENAVAKLA